MRRRVDPTTEAVDRFLSLLWSAGKRLWRLLLGAPKPPRGALVLGKAYPLYFPHSTGPLWLTPEARKRHLYVLGASGAGKTKALEGWIRQDLEAGRGVGVLDLHGDLIHNLLAFLASSPAGGRRLYLIDPSVSHAVPGFNPLEVASGTEPFGQAMELLGVFKRTWAEFWGPRTEEILRNTLLALMEHQLTLLEVQPLLTDRDFRLRVVGKLQNPGVKEFWLARFERLSRAAQAAYVEPVLNKAGAFTSDPYLRRLLGQERSTLDLRRIMDRGDILLVNLSKGHLKENALLLGALIITKLHLTALSRADLPEQQRRSFYLYVDEFQNFASSTFAEILAEARKYGLALTVAHQYLDQLPSSLRAALLGNVLTQAVFRVSMRDARSMAPELSRTYREPVEQVLPGLPKRQAIIRRKNGSVGGLDLPWVLATPHIGQLPEDPAAVAELKERAMGRTALSVDEIESQIMGRRIAWALLPSRRHLAFGLFVKEEPMVWMRWSSCPLQRSPSRDGRKRVQKYMQLITLGTDHLASSGNAFVMPPSVGALHSPVARFDPRLSHLGLRHFVPRLPLGAPSAVAAGSPGESGLRLAPWEPPFGVRPRADGGRLKSKNWFAVACSRTPRQVEGGPSGGSPKAAGPSIDDGRHAR